MAADDFARINWRSLARQDIKLVDMGLTWPPPERLVWDKVANVFRVPKKSDDMALILKCTNMSQITDEQMEKVDRVARGAEYYYEVNIPTTEPRH